jgi:hypothetical protein
LYSLPRAVGHTELPSFNRMTFAVERGMHV